MNGTPHAEEKLAIIGGMSALLPPNMDQPMALMHDLPLPWLSAEPSLEQKASMIRLYEGMAPAAPADAGDWRK